MSIFRRFAGLSIFQENISNPLNIPQHQSKLTQQYDPVQNNLFTIESTVSVQEALDNTNKIFLCDVSDVGLVL